MFEIQNLYGVNKNGIRDDRFVLKSENRVYKRDFVPFRKFLCLLNGCEKTLAQGNTLLETLTKQSQQVCFLKCDSNL